MGSTAFLAVAGVAEKLQIINVMGAAFRLRHNMIDGEILERKCDAAAIAKSLLLAKERVLVRLVVRQLAYIGTLGNVFAVYEIVEKWSLGLNALAHEFGG